MQNVANFIGIGIGIEWVSAPASYTIHAYAPFCCQYFPFCGLGFIPLWSGDVRHIMRSARVNAGKYFY